MDCTPGIFRLADQPVQQIPIDQLDVSSAGKRRCVFSEAARRHYKPTSRTLGGHHAIELAYNRDTDLESFPLFALDQEFLRAFAEYQINSTVWPHTAALAHAVTLQTERLADKYFKFAPRHVVERVGRFVLRDIAYQGLPTPAGEERAQRAKKTNDGNQPLSDHCKRRQE